MVWRHHDTEDTGGLKLTPSQPRGGSTASQQNTVQTSIHETDQLAVGGGDQTILVCRLFCKNSTNTEREKSQCWQSQPDVRPRDQKQFGLERLGVVGRSGPE